jgi:hypothetical protein
MPACLYKPELPNSLVDFFSPIMYKEEKQAVDGKRKPHWLEYVGSS